MKVRFGRAAAFAALAVLSMALAMPQRATAQQNTPQNAEPEQAKVDLGKSTFAEKCSHCHGPNMVNSGTITPDLRRFPDDEQRFVTTVKQGKNNRMPPWGDVLSDDDIANLWAYVSSRRSQ
jgi:mono/diheme cytochrome c family protein